MSDGRLRRLERAWKETGSARDEATYLSERVRASDLSPEGLRLAACLGHEAARYAATHLSLSCQVPPDFTQDWRDDDLGRWQLFGPWLEQLLGLRPPARGAGTFVTPEAWVRMAVVTARAVLPVWERDFPEQREPGEALRAAESWVVSPTAETARRAVRCGRVAYDRWLEQWPGMGPQPDSVSAGLAAAHAALAVASSDADLGFEATMAASAREAAFYAITFAAERFAPQGAFEAIRAEVVPWALRQRDPVRERAAEEG